MARYQPLPSVGRPRPHNLRLADLYLRQGEAQADAELRAGEIKARLFGDIGRTVGQTAASIIQAPQVAREQAAVEAERAQRAKLGALQVGEAERQVNEQEHYDLAMKEGGGSRARTLKLLEGRPELVTKAQGYFSQIDSTMKQLMETAAGGIAAFGYTPEAVAAALDDLEENGFDPAKLKPYRDAMTTPEQTKAIVDRLLGVTPAVPKTREIKVDNPDGTQTIRVVEDAPGQEFTSTPPPKPDTRSVELQIADAMANGDTATVQRLTRAAELASGARRAPEKPPEPKAPPKLPAAMAATVAAAKTSLSGLDTLENMFKPAFVGPVAGRYNQRERNAPSVPGMNLLPDAPEGFEDFQAETAALKNRVIQAITGAAVGVQEQGRIMGEIPDFTDQPSVWKAKAKATRRNLQELMANQIQMGTGAQDTLPDGTTVQINVPGGSSAADPLGIRGKK